MSEKSFCLVCNFVGEPECGLKINMDDFRENKKQLLCEKCIGIPMRYCFNTRCAICDMICYFLNDNLSFPIKINGYHKLHNYYQKYSNSRDATTVCDLCFNKLNKYNEILSDGIFNEIPLIKELLKVIDKNEQKIKRLKRKNKKLKKQIKYMPGSDAYQEAKSHFEANQ